MMRKRKSGLGILFGCISISILILSTCQQNKGSQGAAKAAAKSFQVAVFVPGVAEGSPIYEMLVAGARRAVDESEHASADIVEGGFNQAEWQDKVTTLAATAAYDLIITSNPSMPAICAEVAKKFPTQKFAVMDGHLNGHPQIYTLLFNQLEQGYLVGYMAGLVTTSDMPGVNPELRVGLIAGQRYPMMDQAIRPGFEKGFKAVNQNVKLDFRVIGNWYDANKAAELATAMFETGTDIVLTIAGGANQGVIMAAKQLQKYVLWFDSSGYDLAPGTVAGSGALRNDRAAYETVKQAIAGTLPYGRSKTVGIQEGYVDFIQDNEHYKQTVPDSLRQRMAKRVELLKSGSIELEMPNF